MILLSLASLAILTACDDSPAPLAAVVPIDVIAGSIDVSVATTAEGPLDTDGYLLYVHPRSARVGPTGSVTFASLNPGPHSVLLSDIAPNCEVMSENPQVASVIAGEAVHLVFELRCKPAPVLAVVTYYDNGSDIALVEGMEIRRLTNTSGVNENPSWSPDGRKIAFTSDRDGNFEIYVINADGTNEIRLTHSPGDDRSPTWSPDGRRIAFSSSRDAFRPDQRSIYIMNSDGTNPVAITSRGARDLDPDWSPDGSRIVFVSNRNASLGTWTISPDGDGAQKLTTFSPTENDGRPVWSPDGNTIAFERYTLFDLPVHGFALLRSIYLMNSDGTNIRFLTRGPFAATDAVWAPDGRFIAFTAHGDPNTPACGWSHCDPVIATVGADGTGHLAIFPVLAAEPAWRPTPQPSVVPVLSP